MNIWTIYINIYINNPLILLTWWQQTKRDIQDVFIPSHFKLVSWCHSQVVWEHFKIFSPWFLCNIHHQQVLHCIFQLFQQSACHDVFYLFIYYSFVQLCRFITNNTNKLKLPVLQDEATLTLGNISLHVDYFIGHIFILALRCLNLTCIVPINTYETK